MGLTNEEIGDCREAFANFDIDGSGRIDISEVRAALQSLGQNPSDEDLFLMMSQVDDDGSGELEFPEFLKIMEGRKRHIEDLDDESDTIAAFCALGGNSDKTGTVATEKLRKVIEDFGLTIDIENLIRDTDRDNSGLIDYSEFKLMMD